MYNGSEAVGLALTKAQGYSTTDVSDKINQRIDALQPTLPAGVTLKVVRDAGPRVETAVRNVQWALIEGAILAVIVVFLFLRDWRATLISAIAIPLSAIPAFWFMDLMGFTLNMVTLLSLSLVAGVLVDDAIVEIENIVRHMRMGKSAYQASIDAADEIGLPVVATTFSIVAVFLPVAMMSGLIGQFFISFGLTIVITVLISLAVARMITPMIAAYFLKAKGHASHGEDWLMDRYLSVLRWTLVNRWKSVFIGMACFALQIGTFMMLPATFQPDTDDDTVQVSVEMPPGVTLEQTRLVANRAAAVVRAQPDVKSAFEAVRAGNATIYVSLKDKEEGRERTSTEFTRQVQPLLQDIPDARVSFRNSQRVGGRDVSVLLASSDPAKLNSAALQLVEQMRQPAQSLDPAMMGFGLIGARRSRVRIKMYSLDPLVTGPDQQTEFERVLRDMEALTRLDSNPYIASAYEVFRDHDDELNFFLVSEWVGPRTLGDFIRSHDYDGSREETRRLGAHFLRAVQFMHDRGIVHRNLNPEVIYLTPAGAGVPLKITDFDYARVLMLPSIEGNFDRMGTEGYAAPELWRANDYDHRVDIFSCGAILFELLTGTRLYATISEMLKPRETWARQRLLVEAPAAREVLDQLLESDPDKRATSLSAAIEMFGSY